MKSKTTGKSTSEVEVLNISKHGFWLLLHQHEYFLPFETFPWFKDANVSSILNVELPQPHHLYWPDLDVDLELESIESPEKYPLIYQTPRGQVAAADGGQAGGFFATEAGE